MASLRAMSALLAMLLFLFGLLLARASRSDDIGKRKVGKKINKTLSRYGEYCGPGPDDSKWSYLKPVDDVDRACYEHDMEYGSCYKNLAKDLGYNPPKWLNQIMAVRGFLPKIFQFYVNKYNPTYFECMHQADKAMVKKFQDIHDSNRFPTWWTTNDKSLIESSTDGNHGCVVSLGNKVCVLHITDMFKIAVGTFTKAIDTDLEFLENKTFFDEHTLSMEIATKQQQTSDNVTTGFSVYNGIMNYFTDNLTNNDSDSKSKHYKMLYEQDIIISSVLGGSSVYI